MTDLLKAYAERYSVEEENAYVSSRCKDACASAPSSGSPCRPPTSYGLMYNTPSPLTGRTRFDGKAEEKDFRCWSVLPRLDMATVPSDLLTGEAAAAAANEPCIKCQRQARYDFQLSGAVQPDARFWIGMGLAGAGVLLALAMKAARK